MTKKIPFFQHTLVSWFKANGRSFPWRDPNITDFEKILVEVLLQRTQAETIKKFYPTFFSQFNSWASIANAPIEVLEDTLKPIGLFKQRAGRVKKLALAMLELEHIVPATKAELEAIPMVGQYIANAIRLILHGEPAPLLDVNMARLLERFFGKRKLADIRYDPYLQDLAWKVVQHPQSKELNWAILDFAALVCKARIPMCEVCPLAFKCTFFTQGIAEN